MQVTDPPDVSAPIRPMLAVDGALPVGPAWGFEIAWDGLRVQLYLRPGRVSVVSASGRSVTSSYPEVARLGPLAERHGPLVLDGQLVCKDRLDRPSLESLRPRMNSGRPSESLLARAPVLFYAFDVLYAHGGSTMDLPYWRRRELLAEFDLTDLPDELSPSFVDIDGQTVLNAATQHGLTGIVAKRLDSKYQPGRRTRAWVQTLPRHTQAVLVGGWLPHAGEPALPGSLLVGVPDATGSLRYLGKVSAGLDRRARAELASSLARLARPGCPFLDGPELEANWLAPSLVGEVSYRRWGTDGRLRHASWLGVRPNTHPAAVRGPLVLVSPEVPEHGSDVGRSAANELSALAEAVRLANGETRALQARISQHFLYNMLTGIASYVRTDPDRARGLLYDLADYTRYSYRTGGEITTLGAELINVDRYLGLERARFGHRLRVERDVPEELLEVRVPFLVVQELVENAVRNGIEGTVRGGTVRITAARIDGTQCVLTVSDDGLGGDPDQLPEAIGLVRERLAAAPGPVAGLDVVTAPETGTTVTVRLPMATSRLNA
ncbi:MAG TPA: histidine kinase [Pseudonocardia sp.]